MFLSFIFLNSCSESKFFRDFSKHQENEFQKNQKILQSRWVFKSEKDERHFERMASLFQYGTPYIYKNYVYFGLNDGYFYSLDKNSGRLNWKIKLTESIQSKIIIQDDVAYFGDVDGTIYAIEVGKGKILWTYAAFSGFVSQILVIRDEISLLLSNESLVFLDKVTGKFLWNYERRFEKTAIYGNAIPVYDNGNVYVGFSDGTFIALSIAERAVIWERALETRSKFADIDVRAIIDGNRIYVMTYGGDLYALDKEKGFIEWKAKDVGGVAHMLLHNNHLYVSSSNRKLYVIDPSNGVVQYVFKNPKQGEVFTGPVSIGNYLITGGSRSDINVFTPGLQLVETYPIGSGVIGELAYDEKNAVYFISNYGNVYSLKINQAR